MAGVMGAGASVDHAVDQEEAKKIAGSKFDEGKWSGLAKGEDGKVSAEDWNLSAARERVTALRAQLSAEAAYKADPSLETSKALIVNMRLQLKAR